MSGGPLPRAMMPVAEQHHKVKPDADGGNNIPPPGTPPLIGDGIVHHAGIFSRWLKAVFVHKNRKRPFDHFIHQNTRRLHRLPAAHPLHRNEAPVTAMDLDLSALARRDLGDELCDFYGRRHDVIEIVGITVKREHRLRTGGKRCAGVKGMSHGSIILG